MKNDTRLTYIINLFSDLRSSLPSFYSQRTVPYSFIYFWGSHHRLDKNQTRVLLEQWQKAGLVIPVKFRGVRLLQADIVCREGKHGR